MPIYGFQCGDCDAEFQALVRSSEIAVCPECESTKLSRTLSLIARPAKGGESDAGPACAAGEAGMCSPGPCCMMPGAGCG